MTAVQYILKRCKRLLISFAFGTLLIMPAMSYLADVFNHGYEGDYIQHYRIFFTKFTDLTGADGGFSAGQFWFIAYLFMITLIAVWIFWIQKRIKPKYKTNIPIWGVCLLGLPLPLLHEMLSIGGKSLAEYTCLFLIGYYLFSNENTVEKTEKYRWFFLFIGGTAAIFNVYLFIWSDMQFPFLNTIAKFTSEWFMILALLGIGKRYLNFSGRVSKYLSQRSFAFYIWHFIWVVLFQYILSGICGDHTIFMYTVPVILAYFATLLCCEISVRTPFLRFLTGTNRSPIIQSKRLE